MDSEVFSYPRGLPYNEEDQSIVPLPTTRQASRPDFLDRPLDDFIHQNRDRRSRTSSSSNNTSYRDRSHDERPTNGKIYLLSELNPVINHKMASDLMEEKGIDDHLANEESAIAPPPSDDPTIRLNALYLEGSPLTELPTERVFTYVTSFSTSLPLGIEWISDDRLCVVFPSQSSASVALSSLLLNPAREVLEDPRGLVDQTADSQVVSTSLWPVELRPGPARLRIDEMGEGKDDAVMRGRMGIRWAKTTDKKAERNTHSSFYKKHGYNAGRPSAERRSNPSNDAPQDILSTAFTLSPPSRSRAYGGRSRSPVDRRSASPDASRRELKDRLRSASPGRPSSNEGGSKMRGFGGDLEGRIGERRRDVAYDHRRADRWETGLDAALAPARMSREREGEGEGEGRRGAGRREGGRGEGGRREGGKGGKRVQQSADDLDKELDEFLQRR